MKMTYQVKHVKKSGFGGKFFKLIAVLALTAAGLALLSTHLVNGAVSSVFSPFFKAGNYFYDTLQSVPKFFSSKADLLHENQSLREEINKSHMNALDYRALTSENAMLREALQMKPEAGEVTAGVLAKPPQTLSGLLILDRGSKDGLTVGDEVFISEKVMIGQISEVTDNRSVLTLNSFGGVVSYGAVDRTGAPLELKGAGSGSLEARVPIDFDIVEGDIVVRSGPTTAVIAVVGAVEKDDHLGVQDVFLSMPTDISKVNVVFVRTI